MTGGEKDGASSFLNKAIFEFSPQRNAIDFFGQLEPSHLYEGEVQYHFNLIKILHRKKIK